MRFMAIYDYRFTSDLHWAGSPTENPEASRSKPHTLWYLSATVLALVQSYLHQQNSSLRLCVRRSSKICVAKPCNILKPLVQAILKTQLRRNGSERHARIMNLLVPRPYIRQT